MKYFVLSLIFILAAAVSFSQKKNKNQVVVGDASVLYYDQGKEAYEKGKYSDAIPYFIESLKANDKNEDALYLLGWSYKMTNQIEKALEQFQKLEILNPDYSPKLYYELGGMYSEAGQFEKGAQMQEKFLKTYPSDANKTLEKHQAQYKLHYAKERTALQGTKVTMKEPVKLSAVVNSEAGDYMPMLDAKGTKLYFTSTRKGGLKFDDASSKEGDEDLYYIEKINEQWSAPKLLPEPINTAGNDGAAAFSADGQTMIYAGCSRDDGVGSCDLYISYLEGNTWSTPQNLGNVVNTNDWEAQPTISNDGSKIIFCSGRAGSYGIEDLYMIEKNPFGEWGPAMNLGPVINTPFSDKSPFFSQDGKTLYFSSDGHPGFGGLDIFRTTFENGKWTTPVNMGRPLNTTGDDRYFTIGGAGEVGYFSSNREGASDDLYAIEIPESLRPQATVVVEGIVSNAKTGERVAAHVIVEDLNSGEIIAIVKSNSVSGRYLVVLPSGKSFSVSANKESFFFHSERFDVPSDSKFETLKKDIPLKPIEKGTKIVLNNIFFETGKATLTSQSKVELEKAIDLLNENPTMVIEVGGHTDNVGDDAFNMKLSHDRAKTVRDYLVTGGIASSRVQSKGYGETNPVATNDNEEGRKANRRTEFIILEF